MSKSSKQHRPRERAVIYTRQSTFREESISLEDQEKHCRRHVEQHGYDLVDVLADPGISGLEFDKRPGIKRAIELIEAGRAEVVVVYRRSRFSRHRTHRRVISDTIRSAGGRIESATEPIDTSRASGRLQVGMIDEFNAYEADLKSEQWRETVARRIELGLPAGGAAPLGYRTVVKDPGDKNSYPPLPDDVYAPVVREMYDMYLRGIGPQGIAKTLNERGLSTPRGVRFGVPTITRALDSGFAAGYLQLHDPECPAEREPRDDHVRTCPRRVVLKSTAYEPLIDDATWQRYLQERDRRRQENPNPKSRQPKWVLGAGLAVCGPCGGHMVVDSYRSSKSQAVCSTYKRTRVCEGVWIDRVNLETLVALWLGGHVEEWANAAEAQAGTTDDERARLVKAIDVERAQEAKLRDGLLTAQRLVATGDISEADFLDRKREVDVELGEVTQRLSDLQSRLDALDPAGDAYQRLGRALSRTDSAPVAQPVDVAMPMPADLPIANVVTDNWPTEQVPAMAPEEWHDLLRRIIKKVVVNKYTVVIQPWRGKATTLPKPPPRRRSDVQTRGAKGRFVKTAT